MVIFKLPRDGVTKYVKRVIGLPGDKIQMKEGVLYINGTAVPRVKVEDYVSTDPSGAETRVDRYRETLPNGISYMTLDLIPNSEVDDTGVYEVPPDHYFMLGDNRDNSTDSRFPSATGVGYVPRKNLIGVATWIYWSADLSRLGTKL